MMKDPAGTLKKLADMGYQHVEHANYVNRKFYGWTAKEFKKVLDDLDLQMPSGHTVMTSAHWDTAKNDFTDAWKYTVEDAATMGQKFVISPWMDEKVRHRY
jgi:sugar phosphate isomerase/epimerase